jgi:hypothetical protein
MPLHHPAEQERKMMKKLGFGIYLSIFCAKICFKWKKLKILIFIVSYSCLGPNCLSV